MSRFVFIAAILGAPILAGAAPATFVDDDFTPATPGWGVTHFQQIADAVAATDPGGTVSIAAGTYAGPGNVGTALSRAITIEGAGAGLVTIQTGGAGYGFFVGSNTPASLAQDIVIRGIRFRGNGVPGSNDGGVFGIGLSANNGFTPGTARPLANITIENCRFEDLDNGIEFRNTSSGLTFRNNTFENITNWTAIEVITLATGFDIGPFTVDGVLIEGNTIRNSATLPIKLSNYHRTANPATSMGNITVRGNTIGNISIPANTENFMAAIASRHGVANLRVTDNRISGTTNLSGIHIADGPQPYTGLSIERNRIEGIGGTNDQFPAAGNTPAGIKLFGAVSIAGDVRISANSLRNNTIGIAHRTTTNTHTLTLLANAFDGNATSLVVGPGTNTSAIGNRFLATGSAHIQPLGQFASLAVTGNLFSTANAYYSSVVYSSPAPTAARNAFADSFSTDTADAVPGNGTIDGASRNLRAALTGSNQDLFDSAVAAQFDRDADGLADGAELALGTSITSPFTDGDPMPDGADVAFGLLPGTPEVPPPAFSLTLDTDGDGFADWYEIVTGSDAEDATSRPTLGDVQPNGDVDLADAIRALQIINGVVAGPSYGGADPNAVTVTSSGFLSLNNPLQILRFQNGSRTTLPAIAGIN